MTISISKIIAFAILAIIFSLLYGCGGGEPDEADDGKNAKLDPPACATSACT